MTDHITHTKPRRISALSLHSLQPATSSAYLADQLPGTIGTTTSEFAEVQFTPVTVSRSTEDGGLDSFWKFSIFTDDIVGLRSALIASGRSVSEPVQFGDIGYLCHLEEPGGNAIELLQRTFKDSPAAASASPDTLGLITLRVADVDASLAFYIDGLGMRLLSTMAVDDGRRDPFDLYFLGWLDDELPDPDVASVANREWLYQRRSTLIELQHYRSSPGDLVTGSSNGSRLHHVSITTDDLAAIKRDLTAAGVAVTAQHEGLSFKSPDGHKFLATRDEATSDV